MHYIDPAIRNRVPSVQNWILLFTTCIGISPSDFAGSNEFQAILCLQFIVLYSKQGERSNEQFLFRQEEKRNHVKHLTMKRSAEQSSRRSCIKATCFADVGMTE